MRLDSCERRALSIALKGVTSGAYLFGSRLDDARRGGDIDILILSDADPFELSRRIAVDFFMECEEKIDVVVLPTRDRTPEQEAFLRTIACERLN
jgi:predicted nucleotidyltransferase